LEEEYDEKKIEERRQILDGMRERWSRGTLLEAIERVENAEERGYLTPVEALAMRVMMVAEYWQRRDA
jgi:hypothetical protein